MEWVPRNHIKIKKEFKTLYKKSIKVLLEIILGNIKKKLKSKKSAKGD